MDESKRTAPSHTPGTRQGQEMASQDEGRHTTGRNPAGRPVGKSQPEDFTGINPEQERPIDPSSPLLITP